MEKGKLLLLNEQKIEEIASNEKLSTPNGARMPFYLDRHPGYWYPGTVTVVVAPN
jgi:hypothetical protein